MTIRISNLELTLLKAISTSKFTTGDGDWVFLYTATKGLGSPRNVQKAVDAAVSSGLIELDESEGDTKGARLSKFAKRVMTAIEKA